MFRRSPGEKALHSVMVVILVLVALSMLLPFLHLLAKSISGSRAILNREVFIWPKDLQLRTFKFVITSPTMVQSLINTFYITAVGTLISVLLTAFMGYALSKKFIVVRTIILQLVIFTMLFRPGIIPTYIIVRGFGLIDSRWSLMLPVAISPFFLIIMMNFFRSLPAELEESAVIDGAGTATIFFRIVIPLSMPGIATIMLFYAVQRWNTFFRAVMYINDMAKYPLQVLLREIVVLGTNLEQSSGMTENLNDIPSENIKAASIIFATFPILLVYPFLQKYFVKGVMIGSIKG